MRRRARGRRRRLFALLGSGALCVAAATLPGTSSAFVASVTNATNTTGSASYAKCADYFAADSRRDQPFFEYALNEPSGSATAADSSGNGAAATYQGTMTSSTATPTACPGDTGGAWSLDGASNYLSAPTRSPYGPAAFSVELWFKTTVAAGRLIGWSGSATGLSSTYDRHLYITPAGRVAFGAYNGTTQVLETPSAYTDGAWHLVVGTFSRSTGMCLYLDGALSSCNRSFVDAEGAPGYWRIGYDNLNGWPDAPSSYYFNGSLRFAAAYNAVLTPGEISWHYKAGAPA